MCKTSILKEYSEFRSISLVSVRRDLILPDQDINEPAFYNDLDLYQEHQHTDKFNAMREWSNRIRRIANFSGDQIQILTPKNGYNKFLILGNDGKAQIAASLLKSAIVSIQDNSFTEDMALKTIHETLNEYHASMKIKETPKFSCTLDFNIKIEDFNKRQGKTFDNMVTLFNSLDVEIDYPENKPRSIKLLSENNDALKAVKLTAEFVVKAINDCKEMSSNALQHTFEDQAIQAIGKRKSEPLLKLCSGI